MSTVATLMVNVIGDASGFKSTMSGAAQSMKSNIDAMNSFGTSLTAGVTLPIIGLGIAALKGAADQEQLQVAFTTMLGSAEKATALIQNLQKFSAETPFEMPEVVTAGKQLLAFGIEGENVQETLRMLGDVASGVGAPLGDLTYLFGTASASGRLMTADINQFTTRGIPMIQALAQVFGVSESSIKDMAAAGKITSADMTKAFELMTGEGGRFNGMMAAQSQTIMGLASTLKDNFGQALTAIGVKLIEIFNIGGADGAMAQMVAMTGRIKDGILAFADSNPALFRMAILFAMAAAAVGPLLLAIGWLASAFSAGGLLATGATAIGAIFGMLVSPIGLVIAAVGLLAYAIYNDWGGIGTFAAGVWSQVASAASSFIQPAIEWMSRLTAATIALMSGTDFATLQTSVTTAFSNIGTAIKDFFSGDISLGGLAGAVSQGFSDIGSAIATFFGGQDFSKFVETIQWDQFVEKLTWENVLGTAALVWTDYISPFLWDTWAVILDWTAYLTPIVWDALVVALDWISYISLLAWTDYIAPVLWSALIATLDWATYLVAIAWDGFVSMLTWDTFLTLVDWAMWIPALTWATVIQLLEWSVYLVAITWSAFIGVLNWADATGEKLTWADFVAALEWTGYILAFAWDSFISKLEWTGTISKMEDWGTFITSLDWGKFILMMIDWATWIPALAWNVFIATIEWTTWLVSLAWGDYASKFEWSTFIPAAFAWSSYVGTFLWSTFIPAAFGWGSYVFSLVWSSFVSKLNWPSISWPGWSSWIPAFPGWPDIGGMISDAIGSVVGGNAIGTSNWRGGMTLVGEAGPEMVYLPKGTSVNSASETRRGRSGGGGVVIESVYVNSEIDAYAMAYKLDDIRRRRERN